MSQATNKKYFTFYSIWKLIYSRNIKLISIRFVDINEIAKTGKNYFQEINIFGNHELYNWAYLKVVGNISIEIVIKMFPQISENATIIGKRTIISVPFVIK